MKLENFPSWLLKPGVDLSRSEIGTKAFNLSILQEQGLAVPPCFFIATLGSEKARFESSRHYLAAIDEFSKDLGQVLPSQTGWAIRSSATIEDMPGESHAGRFETLFISNASDLVDAVDAVWESAKSADIGPESMGVIVQQLVDADFAGVAFSNDPTRNDNTTIIECVPGNAARFVDGELTPWRIRPGEQDLVLPDKFDLEVVRALDRGVQHLATELNMAVDTEWAVSNGQLFWLQVRPLTGSSIREFVIPDSQKAELKGLWVRINHSFAPQATLVVSMNPGGYFDGPGWASRLVNSFHYIQEDKRTTDVVEDRDIDRILDEWDQWEEDFEHLFEERQRVDLAGIPTADIQAEILDRIKLSQQYFEKYSDRRFLEIRNRAEKNVSKYVDHALGDEAAVKIIAAQLVGQLGSLTEEKQYRLRRLADLHAEDRTKDIRDSAQWRQFFDTFGSESPTTHLFYLPTIGETPELVFEMVDQMSRAKNELRESERWQTVAASIEDKLPENERAEFSIQLMRLRRCLLRTENDDYALSKCTMLVRNIYLQAGGRLAADAILEDREDVFHLTGEELFDALAGGNFAIAPAVINARRMEFEQSKLLSPPPMIMNGRAMLPKAETGQSTLSGLPASPGVASGIALVLEDPFSCVGKKLPNNAVVVAPIVTPALAYSLIGCAAIVTEIGGMASHGAIVAREMSVPAVVGVAKACSILHTGMSVAVDGSRGEISILGAQK